MPRGRLTLAPRPQRYGRLPLPRRRDFSVTSADARLAARERSPPATSGSRMPMALRSAAISARMAAGAAALAVDSREWASCRLPSAPAASPRDIFSAAARFACWVCR